MKAKSVCCECGKSIEVNVKDQWKKELLDGCEMAVCNECVSKSLWRIAK